MSVNKALESILENRLDDMRSNFTNALTTKAVEKLEERKIDIAQQYFGQMIEEEQVDESIAAHLAGTAAGLGLAGAGMYSGMIPKAVEKTAKVASKIKKKLIGKKK